MPALKVSRRFEIEQILSIFHSRAGKYIEIDEKEYPTAYKGFLERLHAVMKEPNVVRDLVYEEMLNERLQREHKENLQMKEERKTAIINLQNRGMSISEIASVFNLSEKEIEKILK